MHFVFLNQYYPPDAAPTGVMLEAVVERLVRDGHEVTVLCASGGYAGREKLKTEKLKAEISEDVGGCRLAVDCEEDVSGEQKEQEIHEAQARPPTANRQRPIVLRLRASRFGRGTFVGKLLDYASYYLRVAWELMTLHPKPDRIVALTTPPLLSVLARSLSKIRGGDHAHWVMDLYPDVMAAHGMLGEKSAVYRILAGLARWGFGGRRCAALLTLGPDMAERVGRLMGTSNIERPTSNLEGTDKKAAVANQQPFTSDSRRVEWVSLWGESRSVEISSTSGLGAKGQAAPCPVWSETLQPLAHLELRRKRRWGDDELIVMYSGNMGLGHRFGEILAAAERVAVGGGQLAGGREKEAGGGAEAPLLTAHGQPIRFVFFGGGKRRVEVEGFVRDHPGCAVELHDYAPAEELAEHLQSADVHLASLDEAWTGTMVPSKLQGIFAAGRPVIFVGSAESSIGRWVAESGGGWVVREGDVDGLLAALAEVRDPAARLTRGQAAMDFAARHFDKRTNVARVAAILAQQQK